MRIGPEWKKLALMLGVFAACFWLPVQWDRLEPAVMEALHLTRWYAREHVVLCLVPAFFIAGAIAAFISQASVMRYLGPRAPAPLAYGVASVSGSVLTVCSCTVLPLFAGIHRMGAGLGPATAFLYAGPAINVLAIILTARVLGLELGIARAVGAVVFSIVIGLLMHLIFRRGERAKADAIAVAMSEADEPEVPRPLWQNGLFFASMVAILVFANWGEAAADDGFWAAMHEWKWTLTALAGIGLAVVLGLWFQADWRGLIIGGAIVTALSLMYPEHPMIPFAAGAVILAVIAFTGGGELREWAGSTWTYAKLIMPLLLIGIVLAGLLLGRPGHEALIPSTWVEGLVGGNSVQANLFASVVGAFMYFATLTEVPILDGLIGAGMGKGPALALLLAGPALSLPNMLVINGVLGFRKTLVFVLLVIAMATLSGVLYGAIASG
jgi:uncharacterized membrane protein YraQ (UPF0718 family)